MPQASVLMMLPIALVLLLELPLISAMLLSTNAAMIACGDCVAVAVAPEDVVAAFALVPFNALIRLWNAEVRLEVTPRDALEPPLKLPSNSLLPDSVTRLVNAATVEASLADGLAAAAAEPLVAATPLLTAAAVLAVAAPLLVFNRLDNTDAWLLPTLPIDIMAPAATARGRLSAAIGET